MKVTAKVRIAVAGKVIEPGETADLPKSHARRLIDYGWAVEATADGDDKVDDGDTSSG